MSNLIDGYTFAVSTEDGRGKADRIKDLFKKATGINALVILDMGWYGVQFGTAEGYDFLSQRDADLLWNADNDWRLPRVRANCWSTITKRSQWERETHETIMHLWDEHEARITYGRIEKIDPVIGKTEQAKEEEHEHQLQRQRVPDHQGDVGTG